jgi:uncharacterized protein (TIGR00288 family)
MNVGILWDIENVIPPQNTNYIQLILETVSKGGRISYAMAFGDWNKFAIKNIAHELYINNFELIHVPKAGKDSADMSLVAHGVELIFQYPHIDKFVLISGDADFRPLLLSQKKYGKKTLVICDVKNNASEDLLKMADNYLDYREIINIDETPFDETVNNEQNQITKEQAFELFQESIGLTLKENKQASSGGIKIRMKLLNNQFDESRIGYDSWNEFVKDALVHTNIEYDDGFFSIKSSTLNEKTNIIPEVFVKLINEIGPEWVLFTKVAQKINFKKYGYNRFLKLALDAEKRGYVETKNNGLIWEIKKSL